MSILLNQSNYLSSSDFDSKVQTIKSQINPNDQITSIQAIINQVFYNNQKAELLLLRGEAYGNLAISSYITSTSAGSAVAQAAVASGTATTLLPEGSACTSSPQCQSGDCDIH